MTSSFMPTVIAKDNISVDETYFTDKRKKLNPRKGWTVWFDLFFSSLSQKINEQLRILLLPALRASRQASYISSLMSELSSAMVSPTKTKRSTAACTARPTRPSALRDRSAFIGRSGADTSVVICND